MTIKPLVKSLSAIMFSTLFLTACGGDGGGESNSNPTPNETSSELSEQIISEPITSTLDDQNNEPIDNEPVDTGNVPTDNNAKAALNADNIISLARTSCGLTGLSDDPALDKIAIQHANYIKHVFANSTPTSFNAHLENKINDIANVTGDNNPFFSGLSFTNRLLNAKYANADFGVTENIAQTIYFSSAGNIVAPEVAATSMTKSLLAAPYHLRSLMIPASSLIGTGLADYKPNGKNPTNNQGYVLVSHASATQATKDKTVSGIFTYPCQDVTGTVTALYNETPDPVRNTGRDLRVDPIGQPVYISMPSANKIKVSNVKFRDIQRNIEVPIQLLDFDNDPYVNTNYELPENEAFILPLTDALRSCEVGLKKGGNCGLYGNSEYRVSFDILVNDTNLETKQFIFKTGPVNY